VPQLQVVRKQDVAEGRLEQNFQMIFLEAIQILNSLMISNIDLHLFSFANRLNDNIPLLSDSWLDVSEKQTKKKLKDKIL